MFEDFCMVNSIPVEPVNAEGRLFQANNRRRALFLSSVGQRAYAVIHAAVLPQQPNQRSIPTLINVLKNQFEPPGLLATNRFTFHQRQQKGNETVNEYIAAIQALASPCAFGTSLEDTLRDRLVCGIKSDETRRKLLATQDLTYERAKHISLQDDAIRIQSKLLAQATGGVSVNNVRNQKSRGNGNGNNHHNNNRRGNGNNRGNQRGRGQARNPGNINRGQQQSNGAPQQQQRGRGGSSRGGNGNSRGRDCTRCTRQHDPSTCPAYNWVCDKCGFRGHVAARCRTRQPSPNVNNVQQGAEPEGDADQVGAVFQGPFSGFLAGQSKLSQVSSSVRFRS